MNHNSVQLSFWQTRIRPSSLRIALGLFVSLILAFQVVVEKSIGPTLVLFGGLAFILFFMEPIICFYAILILSFINPSLLPVLFNIGDFHFRIVDVFYFLIITRLLFDFIVKGFNNKVPSLFIPLIIFGGYIGLGIFKVALISPQHYLTALVSYSRLLETGLLIPVAYRIVSTEKRLKFLIIFHIILTVISIIIGGWTGYTEVSTIKAGEPMRSAGVLGVNSLGLVSGMMILLAIILYCDRKKLYYLFPGFIGLAGLLLTKSASSLAGTIVTIMWFLFSRKKTGAGTHIKFFISMLLSVVILVYVVSLLRPVDFKNVVNMEGGSFAHRIYLANVGWRIFLNNPLFGVGWQLSSEPDIIGDPEINTPLRGRYNRFDFKLFTDITATSVHNMYAQMLAELGLIGFCLFIWCIIRVKQTKDLIMHGNLDINLKSYTQFLTLSLLFLLIWWNANPLFPGQIETTLACIFLGVLPAIRSMTASKYKENQFCPVN